MKIQIKNRWSMSVIFECEADSLRLAVELAVSKKVSLSYADLRYAYLRGAYLSDANLSYANLSYADLRDAYLRGAYLSDAYLSDANLSGAYLSYADLRYAYLRGAYLSGANLRGANLRDADLRDANLSYANLSDIKKDFYSILDLANLEVAGLYKALLDGKVDGSTYRGECACLVGTIANVKGVNYERLETIKPDSSRPAERWFLGIRKGDTPENNPVSAITADWVREWAKTNAIALPVRKVTWEDAPIGEVGE